MNGKRRGNGSDIELPGCTVLHCLPCALCLLIITFNIRYLWFVSFRCFSMGKMKAHTGKHYEKLNVFAFTQRKKRRHLILFDSANVGCRMWWKQLLAAMSAAWLFMTSFVFVVIVFVCRATVCGSSPMCVWSRGKRLNTFALCTFLRICVHSNFFPKCKMHTFFSILLPKLFFSAAFIWL